MDELFHGKKPFIKLFKTPNSYYCLDANKSRMLELQEIFVTSFRGNENRTKCS